MDSFLKWGNWFDRKYAERLMTYVRWPTMKVALNLLAQMPQHRILETGCVRMIDDWGGGMSTVLFAEFLHLYGGRLTTVDISAEHMNLARSLTAEHSGVVSYVVGNSLDVLPNLIDAGAVYDLIYLDSMDCPVEGDATNSQIHNFHELMLALQMVHDKSIILLDDSDFLNGGKTAQSNAYLAAHGWTCLMSHKQSIWVRR